MSNAEYCAAYRKREAAKLAAMEVAPITFELPKGIRDKFAELRKWHGLGEVELLSNLVLAAYACGPDNDMLASAPPIKIEPDDPIFRHLKRSNSKEVSRHDD